MPWTERQQAMLQEMGLRVWSPPLQRERPAAGGAAVSDAPPLAEAEAAPGPARAPSVSAPSTPSRPTAPVTAAPAPVRPSLVDPDRAAQIATLDWPALREAVAACRACGLCEGRRQAVFGAGGTQAHWMVVGEAPGEQEDRQGEPFVGPAGQLLDRMLAALGLTRDPAETDPAHQVYIANTLKCRPPANRNPAAEELALCEPFLMRQIELLQPRIILAMGRFAVQSLLRTNDAIGKLRGRVHRYQGVPLVVTYHPAYLLRNLPDKARAWQDLCLAAATVEGG